MRHIRRFFGLCCISALLGGCATTLPVQEVARVGAAYDAAAAAAAPLLEELAVAERRAEVRAAPSTASPFTAGGLTVFRSFDPAKAAVWASIGEPASTAAQRRGLKVVGA